VGRSNLNYLDFSLLLPAVMTIADEVDAQLTQSIDSYMKSCASRQRLVFALSSPI
jgi:hypothetical protein